MIPQEIIRRKRNKETLAPEEIRSFINGMAHKEVADIQVAALTMAIFLNGFNAAETTALTLAMRDSGDILNWDGYDKPIVDKHSSGGVGDKVSLMLAPLLAVCDVYVPMIAGRGLGHTGGTIDKLEAISGYNTQADIDLFKKTVKNVGCAIIGQTANLAPADKKIYAIRDVCSTVESIPLITASILSKKLAAGLQYLVMDLKCGNGAFMGNFDDAKALAQSIVDVANQAGTKTRAVLTDMNQVLGWSAGNAVEIREALDYLKNQNINIRLDIITKELGAELLLQCGRCKTFNEALELLNKAQASGAALEKFGQMVTALGGSPEFAENPEKYLPQAKYQKPVYAETDGYVCGMDTRAVGVSIIKLHGGRTVPDQKLNLATGYTEFAQIGDAAEAGRTPLAVVHYDDEAEYEAAKQDLLAAIEIREKQPPVHNPILMKI
ncbi:MAG: thymidine phosphorylase [Alphaproteobacteria bacterium]|nr:thymidine phosphorylase [Alphaproteobacteria bacterium]MDY4689296.1 thymidine phosphorylase [Alphaproteobacteria bacterium]